MIFTILLIIDHILQLEENRYRSTSLICFEVWKMAISYIFLKYIEPLFEILRWPKKESEIGKKKNELLIMTTGIFKDFGLSFQRWKSNPGSIFNIEIWHPVQFLIWVKILRYTGSDAKWFFRSCLCLRYTVYNCMVESVNRVDIFSVFMLWIF